MSQAFRVRASADVSYRSAVSSGAAHNSSLPSKSGRIYNPYENSFQARQNIQNSFAVNQSLVRDPSIAAPGAGGGLSVIGCALAFISTIIGAGIVSLPYSLSQAGYTLGAFLHLLMILFLTLAVILCLKAKDNLGYQSFGELAYLCLGRPSVFVINGVIAAGTSLILIMYALLFSSLCRKLAAMFVPPVGQGEDPFSTQAIIGTLLHSKVMYIVLLYTILLLIILKKQMKELKAITYLLFGGVISMILIFVAKVANQSSVSQPQQQIHTYNKGNMFDSVSIILTSYGFIINFYPIFSSLEKPTNANGLKATSLAMAFCFISYMAFSVLGIQSYGEAVHPNIFENISAEGASLMSVFIIVVFMFIFLCNIPFVFMPGKDALLVLVDEIRTHSLSLELTRRLNIMTKGTLLEGRTFSVAGGHSGFQDTKDHNDMTTEALVAGQQKHISDRVQPSTYYTLTIVLFTVQMLFAILIDDITLLFGFFAAISESMFNFILPGVFYIQSCRVLGIKANPFWSAIGHLYVAIGVGIFVVASVNNVIKIIS